MKTNAFSLLEKYQNLNDRGTKLKKVILGIKDDKNLEDCLGVLKELQKEASDNAVKIKERLENTEIDLEI